MKKVLFTLLSVAVLAACASKGSPMSQLDTKIPTVQELEHHHYQLISVNGKAFKPEKDSGTPTIAFGQDMFISGQMCNRYSGKVDLTDHGMLRAKAGIAMTRMLCTDPILNRLDVDITELLGNGAEIVISKNGQYLRLTNPSTVLEFKLADKI